MCEIIFENNSFYTKHLAIHRHVERGRFICKFNNCYQEFSKYNCFRMHITRKQHNGDKNYTSYLQSFATCCERSLTINEVKNHLKKHFERKEKIKCPYTACNSNIIFSNILQYKAHYYRKHRLHIVNSTLKHSRNVSIVYETENYSDVHERNDSDISDNLEVEQYLRSLATMYLNLQAKHFLTNTTLQTIIESISDLNEISNAHRFAINGTNFQNIDLFKLAHDSVTGCLRSQYCRNLYYKQNFSYVAPVCISLGRNDNHEMCDYYYVPILETLKMLLRNKFVKEQWCAKRKLSNNCFSDIMDGKVFTDNSFFSENENALQLIIFQDAFEICNPIGTSRKKHKLVGMYMTLGNIFPYNRSKVDHIQLVALCHEKHISHFGFSKVFEKLLNDIKILESNGIEIDSTHVLGSVIVVAGDNLGNHQIGCFCENFNNSIYFCRFCYITRNDFKKGSVVLGNVRTPDSYKNDVRTSYTNTNARGVIKDSFLNELKYFHVANPGLAPCIAHDFYEGILPNDLIFIINYWVKQKYISFSLLNSRLNNVSFAHRLCNVKMPLISKKKICGNAVQNMKLLQILPFAIFDKIDYLDPVWAMFLCLREISNILLAVKLSIGQVAKLNSLIHEYFDFRQSLFPDRTLKPKHHFVMHYPSLIQQFGPLRHVWTLRFESKHSYFKNIVRHTGNFKNVAKTLSEKHQLLQALRFSEGTFFSDKIIADQAVVYQSENYSNFISHMISAYCPFKDPIFIAESSVINGTTYKKSMFIPCYKNIFGIYILCELNYLIINNEYAECFIIGQKREIFLNVDSGLYETKNISKENDFICINLRHCISHEPVLCCKIGSNTFFYFQQAPFENL